MMPQINFLAIVVAALIPNLIGMLWYGPLFRKAWLNGLGKTEEEMKPKNPGLVYGLAFGLAIIMAFIMKIVMESLHKGVNEAGELVFTSHHTFGHGAMHGGFMCLFMIMPVLVSMSLFHKISAKNILLNLFFWVICFAIMGGIVDAWV